MNKISFHRIFFFLTITALTFFASCSDEPDIDKKSDDKINRADIPEGQEEQVEFNPYKDYEIVEYNLREREKLAGKRFPCDTLSLAQFILDEAKNLGEKGSYLMDFDKIFTYSVPSYATVYEKRNDTTYIFALIAKSRLSDDRDIRVVEPKNLIGFLQSYIDLDSTELGTALFYLTLYRCIENKFEMVWEAEVPNHGGFNKMWMRKWDARKDSIKVGRKNSQTIASGTPYIQVQFHWAIGQGHFDFNYFLVDGIEKHPHLLLTYIGINFKRTMTNLNDDKFPDYYEYLYYDTGDRVRAVDSIGFVWREKDSLYYNTRNPRQTRKY